MNQGDRTLDLALSSVAPPYQTRKNHGEQSSSEPSDALGDNCNDLLDGVFRKQLQAAIGSWLQPIHLNSVFP